jgi:hypothetical protein
MTITVRGSLFNAQQAMARFQALYRELKPYLIAGHRFDVVIRPEKRSTAQNRRMWAMLGDLSEQVVWHGQRLSADDWKTMCTASLKNQRVLPGIEGGFVVMGESTSQMTVTEMATLMDFIEAFGTQNNVDFGEVLAPEPA